MNRKKQNKTISLNYLARVEGEGSLHLEVRDNEVTRAHLDIFEPPRYFEAFLEGRSFREAPDITARICGICPVAYQMSAVHAMEKLCQVHPVKGIRDLRRLLYCGEWIESHALHLFMLHAPDFLGYPDAIAMAADHREWVEKGLRLKKTGNDIMVLLGGREIHPINVKVGGFYHLPEKKELEALLPDLEQAREIARETVKWTSSFEFPDYTFDYTFVALRHPNEYPMNEGRLVSNRGLDITAEMYEDHFSEEHVSRSNALHSVLEGEQIYLTGPMARFALNFDQLDTPCQSLCEEIGLACPCRNPFKSIVIRALETYYACNEAIRLIKRFKKPSSPAKEVIPRAGKATAITEAPRGILYHGYELDDKGNILTARIVPPTSQNQKIMEEDLRGVATAGLQEDTETLTHRCEQAIRNYDPCISCATHFLRLTLTNEL